MFTKAAAIVPPLRVPANRISPAALCGLLSRGRTRPWRIQSDTCIRLIDRRSRSRDRTVHHTPHFLPDAIQCGIRSHEQNAQGRTHSVPDDDGSSVAAQILMVSVSLKEATDRLYRRETRKSDLNISYVPPKKITPNTVVVESRQSFEGIETVLYTKIGANIDDLTASKLAKLAVDSARAQQDGKDGISYLMNAKKCGIQTPLSLDYENEILRLTGTDSLEAALASTRRRSSYLPGEAVVDN